MQTPEVGETETGRKVKGKETTRKSAWFLNRQLFAVLQQKKSAYLLASSSLPYTDRLEGSFLPLKPCETVLMKPER